MSFLPEAVGHPAFMLELLAAPLQRICWKVCLQSQHVSEQGFLQLEGEELCSFFYPVTTWQLPISWTFQ